MINMFIRIIFVIFHHLNHVDWKRMGLCVVDSPPETGNGIGRGGMNKGDKIKMIERCKWSPLMMIIVIFNMITITMIGWSVCFCERPRAWWGLGSHGRRFQGLGGSGRARFPNIRISSSKLHNFHKIIITVLEYTNTQMMTYYYILLLYIAYYFY